MRKWGLLVFELAMFVLVFIIWYLVWAISCAEQPIFNSDHYVRNYVWEELYMMTSDSGITKAKVVQQDLFEWGKVYYIDNGVQTFGMNEEDFMKLRGQQKDLAPKKK